MNPQIAKITPKGVWKVKIHTPFSFAQKHYSPLCFHTFGIYIDRIADMKYREQLLKVLIPMQMELDSTAEIYESEELATGTG